MVQDGKGIEVQTLRILGKEARRKEDSNNGKYIGSAKRNSQPTVTPLERKEKNPKYRIELSYPLDSRRNNIIEKKYKQLLKA